MIEVKIETKKKREIEEIQRLFKDNLSKRSILAGTSQAINTTMRQAATNKKSNVLMEETLKQYAIQPKDIKGTTVLLSSKPETLEAGVKVSYKPIQLMHFNPVQKRKKTKTGKIVPDGPVELSIIKGKPVSIPSAWIGVAKSGGITGKGTVPLVWARGKYIGKEFQWSKERMPITPLKTASPFVMSQNKEVNIAVNEFIGKSVVDKTKRYLQEKVDKLTK